MRAKQWIRDQPLAEVFFVVSPKRFLRRWSLKDDEHRENLWNHYSWTLSPLSEHMVGLFIGCIVIF